MSSKRNRFAKAIKENPFSIVFMALLPLLLVILVLNILIAFENRRLVGEIAPKLDAVGDKINDNIDQMNDDIKQMIVTPPKAK
ncbi:hypothetical protein [Mesorhizobium sp. SP-1A]|uniref:hypothetical protein n=1 Tax=Mesorhizobium sp. SP-1A TaxID=3077840 RepID=UPI0028F745EA|nr:hypothetical protein [Mesorhizobium sp. SP-1A]